MRKSSTTATQENTTTSPILIEPTNKSPTEGTQPPTLDNLESESAKTETPSLSAPQTQDVMPTLDEQIAQMKHEQQQRQEEMAELNNKYMNIQIVCRNLEKEKEAYQTQKEEYKKNINEINRAKEKEKNELLSVIKQEKKFKEKYLGEKKTLEQEAQQRQEKMAEQEELKKIILDENRKLTQDLENKTDENNELQKEVKEKSENIQGLEKELVSLENKERSLEDQIAEKDLEIKNNTGEIGKLQEDLAQHEADFKELGEKADERINEAESKVREKESTIKSLKNTISKKVKEVDALNEAQQTLQGEQKNLKESIIEARGKIARKKIKIKGLKESGQTLIEDKSLLEKELEESILKGEKGKEKVGDLITLVDNLYHDNNKLHIGLGAYQGYNRAEEETNLLASFLSSISSKVFFKLAEHSPYRAILQHRMCDKTEPYFLKEYAKEQGVNLLHVFLLSRAEFISSLINDSLEEPLDEELEEHLRIVRENRDNSYPVNLYPRYNYSADVISLEEAINTACQEEKDTFHKACSDMLWKYYSVHFSQSPESFSRLKGAISKNKELNVEVMRLLESLEEKVKRALTALAWQKVTLIEDLINQFLDLSGDKEKISSHKDFDDLFKSTAIIMQLDTQFRHSLKGRKMVDSVLASRKNIKFKYFHIKDKEFFPNDMPLNTIYITTIGSNYYFRFKSLENASAYQEVFFPTSQLSWDEDNLLPFLYNHRMEVMGSPDDQKKLSDLKQKLLKNINFEKHQRHHCLQDQLKQKIKSPRIKDLLSKTIKSPLYEDLKLQNKDLKVLLTSKTAENWAKEHLQGLGELHDHCLNHIIHKSLKFKSSYWILKALILGASLGYFAFEAEQLSRFFELVGDESYSKSLNLAFPIGLSSLTTAALINHLLLEAKEFSEEFSQIPNHKLMKEVFRTIKERSAVIAATLVGSVSESIILFIVGISFGQRIGISEKKTAGNVAFGFFAGMAGLLSGLFDGKALVHFNAGWKNGSYFPNDTPTGWRAKLKYTFLRTADWIATNPLPAIACLMYAPLMYSESHELSAWQMNKMGYDDDVGHLFSWYFGPILALLTVLSQYSTGGMRMRRGLQNCFRYLANPSQANNEDQVQQSTGDKVKSGLKVAALAMSIVTLTGISAMKWAAIGSETTEIVFTPSYGHFSKKYNGFLMPLIAATSVKYFFTDGVSLLQRFGFHVLPHHDGSENNSRETRESVIQFLLEAITTLTAAVICDLINKEIDGGEMSNRHLETRLIQATIVAASMSIIRVLSYGYKRLTSTPIVISKKDSAWSDALILSAINNPAYKERLDRDMERYYEMSGGLSSEKPNSPVNKDYFNNVRSLPKQKKYSGHRCTPSRFDVLIPFASAIFTVFLSYFLMTYLYDDLAHYNSDEAKEQGNFIGRGIEGLISLLLGSLAFHGSKKLLEKYAKYKEPLLGIRHVSEERQSQGSGWFHQERSRVLSINNESYDDMEAPPLRQYLPSRSHLFSLFSNCCGNIDQADESSSLLQRREKKKEEGMVEEEYTENPFNINS